MTTISITTSNTEAVPAMFKPCCTRWTTLEMEIVFQMGFLKGPL